jgi:hypothetical protein
MKTNRLVLILVLLLLSPAALQLHAQQSEADSKLLAEIRAQAEKGNAQSQFELGSVFDGGAYRFEAFGTGQAQVGGFAIGRGETFCAGACIHH